MEWTIRPGAIDLLCRDQEFTSYQHQQKSTSETIIKKEGWWQRFTKQVKNFWGKVQPVISTITAAASSLTALMTTYSKLKEAFQLVNGRSKSSCF